MGVEGRGGADDDIGSEHGPIGEPHAVRLPIRHDDLVDLGVQLELAPELEETSPDRVDDLAAPPTGREI